MNRTSFVGIIGSLLFSTIMAGASGIDNTTEFEQAESASSESGLPIGMIYIESPKRGMLMNLQGTVGKGKLIAKQRDGSCVSVAIRITSGNFNGHGIGFTDADSIQLIIHSRAITESLLAGREVLSDQYTVGYVNETPITDLQIGSGLSTSHGFVLNPGEWSWASLFGLARTEVACDRLPPA